MAVQLTHTETQRVIPIQRGWKRGDPIEGLFSREWLVTNGLGGYASGTIGGASTRRFHGHLVAALPAPHGRVMMFNHLEETITSGELRYRLSGDEHGGGKQIGLPEPDFLEEFFLEDGLPVWRFSKRGIRIEKRIVMPHLQNTTWITWVLLEAPEKVTLHLRPSFQFRPHEGLLNSALPEKWTAVGDERSIEISTHADYPPLRLALFDEAARLDSDPQTLPHVIYRIERSRGYDFEGPLWSPGVIHIAMRPGVPVGIVGSTEPWEIIRGQSAASAFAAETTRRERLLSMGRAPGESQLEAQLVLAADQFLIQPHTRAAEEARSHAAGEDARTVIAGYHWFTDWGRDTMISLEGLTLSTGRHREAGSILRTFASYIRDGLIPNMFPEGENEGLYHTADATMWFFHAVSRYVSATNDRGTLRVLLPSMMDIVGHHVRGTRFNIGVDPEDGLLRQGQEGYQLTWMDAKVDGWVVTPRRGKAVEINALFYNALRILETFLRQESDTANAAWIAQLADRVHESFNRRFWFEKGGYLYDVIDTEEGGDDPALRPNQIFAISLDHPVLDRSRWPAVLDVVRRELLTPFGLRSLSRDHPDYRPAYDGDLRARDAAYHQGTVWSWLIGPFIDAWLKVHPEDRAGAAAFVSGFEAHLGDACIGTVSEVFDAEEPFHPRGCAAQAWGVAELLRSLKRISTPGS